MTNKTVRRGKVYDEEHNPSLGADKSSVSNVPAEQLERIPTSADAYPVGHPSRNNKAVSTSDLSQAEPAGGVSNRGAVGSAESRLGKGFTGAGGLAAAATGNPIQRLGALMAKNKKKTLGGAGLGIIMGGFIFLMGTLQGPLQFIHFAQLMEKFHFSSNDEFVEGRSDKILLYKVGGFGGERGRLGVVSNKAADAWAKHVEARTGLRPLYSEGTFRHVGWLIVDEQKARPYTQQARADGHDIRRARADVGGQKLIGPGNDTSVRDGNRQAIVYKDERGFKGARTFNKFVSKGAGPYGISQAGARLLKHRGGVSFKVLEKYGFRQFMDSRADKREDKKARDEYKQTVKQRFAKKVKAGFKSVGRTVVGGNGQDADGDGVEDTDPNAPAVDEETAEVVQEYQAGKEESGEIAQKIIRQRIVSSGIGATAAVGIMCSVKAVGDQQEEYKYANNILPMMRLGTAFMSIGAQVASGDEVDLDELNVFNDYFFNEEDGTSSIEANTIRQERGEKPLDNKKYDPPKQADLRNATDKSDIFEILDSIGPLGTACGVQDAIFGLPIIKQASDAIGFITTGTINGALSAFGTSMSELMDSGLAISSGDSINPFAEGAEFGNLANIGSFLAAADKALTVGGRALSGIEVGELKQNQNELERYENSQKSFAQRYLNIYDSSSVLGSMSMNMPSSFSQFASQASSFNPFSAVASSVNGRFTSYTSAESAEEVYGAPKIGFSIEEQSNDKFEDPFENGEWIETGDRLEQLNSKYGKCFNMKIIPGADSYKLESDETVNILKMEKEKNGDFKDCYDDSEELLRFRFYLADAVTAKSLACYYDDEAACSELGFTDGAPSVGGDSASATLIDGSAQQLAQKLLDYKNEGKYACDNPEDCADIELMAKGESISCAKNPCGGAYQACHVDQLSKKVLQLIIYLIDSGYKIGTYALCRSHSDSGGVHDDGLAVDISSINGKSLGSGSGAKQVALEVDKIVFDFKGRLTPEQIITWGVGGVHYSEFSKYNRSAPGVEGGSVFDSDTLNGHMDHIHVGY